MGKKKGFIIGLMFICSLAIVLPALAEENVVTTETQVKNYSRAVYDSIKKYGFEFNEPVVVKLVDAKMLTEVSQISGIAGLAKTEYQNLSGRKKVISGEILLQSGLSVPVFQRHLAHELCHIWVRRQGNFELDRIFEEGSCEALSFIAVYEIGSHDAARIMSSIENNPDGIYGNGFRLVRDFINQHGMTDWRNLLAGHNLYIWAENTFPSSVTDSPRTDSESISSVTDSPRIDSKSISSVEGHSAANPGNRVHMDVTADSSIRQSDAASHITHEPYLTGNLNIRYMVTLPLIALILFVGIWTYMAGHNKSAMALHTTKI